MNALKEIKNELPLTPEIVAAAHGQGTSILSGPEYLAALTWQAFIDQQYDVSALSPATQIFCARNWLRLQFERWTWPFPAVRKIQ
jgi:hypothetical protein